MTNGPHQNQPPRTASKPLADASAAMILIHGRGATAASILDLAPTLPHENMVYLAPQASGNTWYPYSFLSPIEQNEPGISSAMQVLTDLIATIEEAGISADRLILAGFSQGACLASEFVARNPRRYGGLFVFSGGLIGPPGTRRDYPGSLEDTPVFIGCSDNDPHIPVERVHETTTTLESMGANVNEQIYGGMPHTIIQDEIDHARKILDTLPG